MQYAPVLVVLFSAIGGYCLHRQTSAPLNDKIRRMRAALEWYANQENYKTEQDCFDILIDGGGLARRALEE